MSIMMSAYVVQHMSLRKLSNLQKSPVSFQRSLSLQLVMAQNMLSLIAAALKVAHMRMK
jgi:hypothetical protein